MRDFATKRNALFACLDDASSELKGTSLDQTNSTPALKRAAQGETEMVYRQGSGQRNKNASERSLNHLRGKESIFKKPELPIARCLKPRRLPDYQINPHKWKKYSLEDVDISDQTNSSAAYEFLRHIDEQKDLNDSSGSGGEEKYDAEDKKIEFKKSSKIRRNLKSLESQEQFDAEIDSPKLKGSKLVMPEYVVGQKKPVAFKKKTPRGENKEKQERAAGKLLLSHLQEDDEEDCDVNDTE